MQENMSNLMKAGVFPMLRRLHYVSPKGCAEMVAESISHAIDTVKEALPPAYMPENIGLMFLGCEGTKADKTTLEFISTLNPKRVSTAALFCCNAKQSDAALQQVKAALQAQGIKVMDSTYVCSGKGLFGGKNPSEAELAGAAKWALKCMEQ